MTKHNRSRVKTD